MHFARVREALDLPDLVLMGRLAVGSTVPHFAVSANAEILLEYQRLLPDAVKVISNAPHRWLPRGAASRLGFLLTDRRMLFAPDRWPPLASGPLALWALNAMGYSTVYLYGMDGSMDPEIPDGESAKIKEWERWACHYHWSRKPSKRAPDVPGAKVYRVLPKGASWEKEADPLRRIILGTVAI